ncbi:MAG: hypothetical protein GWN32_02125, partial [Gemmatimonadetes bacterium]|nr:hypothetical protein [Gemmatimonadota bacterium]NIW35385.1 hypothetical protein [Gemmatimonadota bacterium]
MSDGTVAIVSPRSPWTDGEHNGYYHNLGERQDARDPQRAIAVGFLAALAFTACRSEPPGPADRLVDAWIEAAGGLDAWRDVESLRYTVTTVWFDSTGTEVRRRPRFVWGKKHPLRARIERDE